MSRLMTNWGVGVYPLCLRYIRPFVKVGETAIDVNVIKFPMVPRRKQLFRVILQIRNLSSIKSQTTNQSTSIGTREYKANIDRKLGMASPTFQIWQTNIYPLLPVLLKSTLALHLAKSPQSIPYGNSK